MYKTIHEVDGIALIIKYKPEEDKEEITKNKNERLKRGIRSREGGKGVSEERNLLKEKDWEKRGPGEGRERQRPTETE